MSGSEHDPRYEASDASAGPIVLAGFVLALLLGLAMAVSAWLNQTLVEAESAAGGTASPLQPLRAPHESPTLQAVPARELRAHRAWEEEQLVRSGWIDPVNRIVRIPIERAIEKSLAEGFPVRGEKQEAR